VHKFLVRCFA